MKKNRWTIIVVPQGSSRSRVIEITETAMKLGAILALGTVIVALFLGYGTVARSINMYEAKAIAEENTRLAADLNAIQGRLARLTDSISTLEVHDSRIRLLANLEPIDPQVHAAGIGGPVPVDGAGEPAGELEARAGTVRVDVDALIRRANLLTRSFREAADSLASHTDRLAATPSIMPTAGWLSSAFAAMREHPILHTARPHEGVDITAPKGTPIEAPARGRVTFAGWETGYGNMVTIDHGYGIVTRFAHASRLLVKVGARVERGQRIAMVGNSGLSTSPHLHYEVHVNGRPVNPLRYLLPDVVTD
ncbi:MAG: M23 family metallopeptidase [Gemmatimonadales bacterium]